MYHNLKSQGQVLDISNQTPSLTNANYLLIVFCQTLIQRVYLIIRKTNYDMELPLNLQILNKQLSMIFSNKVDGCTSDYN